MLKLNQLLSISALGFCALCSDLNGAVYASYRNTENQNFTATNQAMTFNVEDVNIGSGIVPNSTSNASTFTVQAAGPYLINYGLSKLGSSHPAGFNLTLTRNGSTQTIDQIASFTSGSSSIVVECQVGDIIKVVTQVLSGASVGLYNSMSTMGVTTETYTGYITFVGIGGSGGVGANQGSLY